MQVNQRVYLYFDNVLHSGIVEKIEIERGEMFIKDMGWRMIRQVGETPEEAAQKLHEYDERHQLRIRTRIREAHAELRAVNERVAAGPVKPTAQEIEAAHARTATSVDSIANYTGAYENAAR